MGGHGVGRSAERIGDISRGHAVRSDAHETAEHFQPAWLRECRKGCNGICCIHISRNMEMIYKNQGQI